MSLKLFAGSIHPVLCSSIAKHLGISLEPVLLGAFANRETRVELKQSCRGCDAFVIQPLCNSEDGRFSINDSLMELLLLIAALRGASAKRITACLPILGYARQDKREKARAAISARLVADCLMVAGVDRIMTVELHAAQIEGFFSKPVDNLTAEQLIINSMRAQFRDNFERVVIVSPDAGGAKRASRIATLLQRDCAIISKTRLEANVVEAMRLVGSVRDKIAVVVDDMADTSGTLVLAANTLRAEGALQVHAYVVHGIFSTPAIKRINECTNLMTVTTTNTIPQQANSAVCPKLRIIDVSKLMADAIRFVSEEKSLTSHL